MPVSVETFHALPDRQTSVHIADPGDRVECQNSAMASDQRFQAAASY